jgi:hypothetical protein
MATYKNNGAELVFPTLTDPDGNVLVVAPGATFEAPDKLDVAGVVAVSAPKKIEDTK